MKVVGQELGRVSYLSDLVEIQPIKSMGFTDLATALRDRYGFAVLPKIPTQEVPQDVWRFEHGHTLEPMRSYINYFEIHPQGLVVQAGDTSDADAFFEDLFAVGRKDFGLRAPIAGTKKAYLSSMVVEFERDVSGLISKWTALSGFLNYTFKQLYELEEPYQIQRIALKPDPQRLPPRWSGLLSDFTIERRNFAPFAANRFYSIGPFPTDVHIKVLEHIESLVR